MIYKNLFLIVFIIVGCRPNQNSNYNHGEIADLNIIVYEDLSYSEYFDIEEFVDSVFYIFPETNQQTRMGSYDKIVFQDERIYIMDNTYTMSVFCFEMTGQFLFKVSNAGSGPGEYRELRDFTLNPDKGTIDILDFAGGSIMQYSSADGLFIDQIRISGFNENYAAYEYNDKNYLIAHDHSCYFLGDCYNLSFRDTDFNLLGKDLPANVKIGQLGIQKEFHFSRNGNNVYYHEFFNDTVYKVNIKGQAFDSSIYVDFGSLKIDEKLKQSGFFSSYLEISSYCANNNKTWGIHSFNIASNGIVFIEFSKPNIRTILYDLRSKNGYSLDKKKSNIFKVKYPIAAYQDFFVSYVESEFLYNNSRPFFSADSTELRVLYPEYFNQVKNIKRDDNYMLTFYRFKNL